MPSTSELFALAWRCLQAGAPAQCGELCRQVVAADPDHAGAWQLLGVTAHQAGQLELAIEALEKAAALDQANAVFHSNLTEVYRQAGKLREAAASGCRAIRLRPDLAEAHNNLGLVFLDQGQPAQAAASFQEALGLRPAYADAHSNLGTAWRHLGRPEEATACYERALALQPDLFEAHLNLGNVLKERGRLVEAAGHCRQAVGLQPNHAEAHCNLGTVLFEQGQVEEAVACFQRALALAPALALAHNNLGNARARQGRLREAEACYREALRLAPDYAQAENHLALALLEQGKRDEATSLWGQLLRRRPDFADAHSNLAALFLDQGHLDQAAAHYREVLRIQPSKRARLWLATMLPAVYESQADLVQRRARFIEGVQQLRAEGFTLDPDRELPPTCGFLLAYQGCNDRDVLRDLSRLYRPAGGERRAGLRERPESDPPSSPLTKGGNRGVGSGRSRLAPPRIRVGFLSYYFREHTVGRVIRGLIAHLSRAEFSVHVLALGRHSDDGTARAIRAQADHYFELPPNLPAARRLIGELELDLLFYPEIGMDPLTCALALWRLAPVQCVGWGHPATTGLDTIDYFVSSELFEGPDAGAHYTETLVLLPTLPCYYYRPAVPLGAVTQPRSAEGKGRAAFGLPRNAHLYACPQTLFKLHPHFDALLAEILRRDPRGQLLLVHAKHPSWDEALRKRWSKTMPDALDRVHFLPWLPRPEFLSLVAVCDVLLDPMHFNGGTTSYECLPVGTPIVTLPGEFLRGRLTQALYRKMGVTDCIAASAEHYVELAVKLGTEPDYRQAVRAKILAASDILYEDIRAVRELEAFFHRAVAQVRSSPCP